MWVAGASGIARAQPAPGAPAVEPEAAPAALAAERRAEGALVILPAAAAIHVEDAWDVALGGAALVALWPARERLALLGAGVSGAAVSARGGGRVGVELAVGVRVAPALPVVGLSLGPVLELDSVRRPRAGAQATLWLAAGAVPYARLAAIDRTGVTAELGLAVALPTLRW